MLCSGRYFGFPIDTKHKNLAKDYPMAINSQFWFNQLYSFIENKNLQVNWPKECRMFEKIDSNKNGINYKLKID
jgi:hypothetical protein